MNGNQLNELTIAEKFLMAGNLASIIGVALVSTGSLLRMVQNSELSESIMTLENQNTNRHDSRKDKAASLYGGRKSYFES